jgi:hypothetical protein
MKRTAILSVLIAASLALPGVAAAQGRGHSGWSGRPGGDSLGADWRPQQDEARQGVRQGRMLPLWRRSSRSLLAEANSITASPEPPRRTGVSAAATAGTTKDVPSGAAISTRLRRGQICFMTSFIDMWT